MDINQVRFGNYTIGNPNAGTKKSSAEQEKETTQTPVQEQNKTLNEMKIITEFVDTLDLDNDLFRREV